MEDLRTKIYGFTNITKNKFNIFEKFNIFNNILVKKIVSILFIFLVASMLVTLSIGKLTDNDGANSNMYFLNQCMWAWTWLLVIIIIVNLFGLIK